MSRDDALEPSAKQVATISGSSSVQDEEVIKVAKPVVSASKQVPI